MTLTTGCENWWLSKQGPEWVPEENGYKVIFWWRDPAGTEYTSAVKHVWIYITGVTDHHQNSRPCSLTRIPGTDVWYREMHLGKQWRGSYCFIPSTNEQDFADTVFTPESPDKKALSEGWRKLFPQAIADPLNSHSWRGGLGHPVSGLEMPDAPVQPGWHHANKAYPSPLCIRWNSSRLANTRRVWVFTTGEANVQQRPLAILLDGQFWAESIPVWPALSSLTHEGLLPQAVYVLIDAIDTAHRSHELTCNPDFWLAVQEELLPQVQAISPFSHRSDRTVVAGQSYGGLAALYAGLHWPQRFGCILSQSGSYWWPYYQEQQDGVLTEQLKNKKITARGLRIILEAGIREPLIFRSNQALYAQLQNTQHPVVWRQLDGGHDAFCWRGGLTQGLLTLWQPLTH